jgi:hypothetical protein
LYLLNFKENKFIRIGLYSLILTGFVAFLYSQFNNSKTKNAPSYTHRLMMNSSQERPILRKIASLPATQENETETSLTDNRFQPHRSGKKENSGNNHFANSHQSDFFESKDLPHASVAGTNVELEYEHEVEAEVKTKEKKNSASGETSTIPVGIASAKKSTEDSKATPAPPTNSTTPSGQSVKKPLIHGTIAPLVGVVSSTGNSFNKLIFNELWAANTCTNASVMVFDLATMSVLANNPLTEKVLDSSTQFEFDPEALDLDLKTPARYILKTSGCLQNYERIITNFYSLQDLTSGTTLISKTVKSSINIAYNELELEEFANFTDSFSNFNFTEIDLENVYNDLSNSSEFSSHFSKIFGGASPAVLLSAAPDISSVVIPTSLSEKSATNFSILAQHWSSSYTVAYEWWIDNNLVSSSSSAIYTPTANSKTTLPLKLFIGKKNAGDNRVNRNFPFHEISSTLIVQDTYPVAAPLINIATSDSLSNDAQIDLIHNTGAFVDTTYANCSTFSSYAITESNVTPQLSEFTHSCNSGPAENFSYTLANQTDGIHNLYFYALDINGHISSPSAVSAKVDKTAPTLAFVNLSAIYRANKIHTFTWSVTEQNSLNTLNYHIEFFDGSSWSDLPSVASINGSLLNAQFSTAVSLPNVSITTAKMRISFTDAAGNMKQLTSPDLSIQKPFLGISPASFDFGPVVSLSTGNSQVFSVNNSGLVSSDSCSSPVLSGANAAEFSIVNNTCASSILNPGGQCTIEIAPIPLTKGSKTAFITQSCGPDNVNGTISFTSTNNPPTRPIDNFLTVNEDTPSSLTLLQGSDIDFDTLTYSIGTPPAHGTLSNCLANNSDLVCDYTPNADFNGADSFTYKINDGTHDSLEEAVVNITINPINDAPVMLANQTITTSEDALLNITLNGATDIDLPAQTLSYKLVTPPTHGTLSNCIDNSTFKADVSCTYTPALDYDGTDSFTYIANDSVTNSASFATVTINITSMNDAPTLTTPQNITVAEDIAHNFNLGVGSDIDGDSLDYIILNNPDSGTLTCTGGTSRLCTYTPNLNFNGNDFFTYKVNDGLEDSNIATVNITVTPINDAPTLVATQSLATNEDTILNFSLNAGSDIEADTLSYLQLTNPASGTLSCTGGTSRACTYTPALNFNGTATFTYKVNDGLLDSNAATVTITVNAINDAPVLPATQTVAATEDTVKNFNLNAGTDVEGSTLSYAIVSAPATGTLTCTGGTSTACTYTPTANFNGVTTFTYKTNDGTANSNIATVTITVDPVNDAPTIPATQSVATSEDDPVTFDLNTGTDIDGDTLSYMLLSNPAAGSLICDGGISKTCTYTPALDDIGSYTFTYKVNDGLLDSNVATVTVTISNTNDAPVMAGNQSLTTNEDTALNFTLSGAVDIDVPTQTLSYKIFTQTTHGTISACIVTGSYGTDLTCTYTPTANYNGPDSFTYKAYDGIAESNSASTVSFTVNAVNDAPVMLSNQSDTTTEDTAINITLSGATDIDLPAQTISYRVVTAPANGTLSNCITAGGFSTDVNCTYTPNANFNGTDSFVYKANDTVVDSSTNSTFTITVNAVNDAPTIPATQALATNEDTVLNFNLNVGTDIEGSALSYIKINNPATGTLTCTGGTSTACTYTPGADFNGTATFTYKVNDGSLDSNIATVTITVNAINDAPVMTGNQSLATNEDTAANFTLNGATDIDLPAQTISYRVVSAPSNGTLSGCITAGAYLTDVTCTYTPNANFNGTDTFTYKSNDSVVDSGSVSTVTITVNSVNDAPVMLSNQSDTTTEDTAINITLSGATDIDLPAQTISYRVVTAPANGTLSNCITAGGFSTDVNCTYTPNANFNGTDSFVYKANDTVVDSSTNSTFTITVTPVNDAPTIPTTQALATNEDTVLNLTLNIGTDIEGSTLSYIKVTDPASGTLTCTGGTSRACTYTPAANFNGTTTFTYKANDGGLDSNIATVTITVNAVNDAPTIPATQAVATNEDTVLNFNLNVGTDIEGSTLSYFKLTSPASGTLTCTGGTSQACTYTPAANFNGTTTFTYKVNDGSLDSNIATVTITVNPVNDAPTVPATQSLATNEDTTLNFNLSVGTDIDGDALTYIKLTNPASGTLTCTGGASTACSYVPAANYNGSVTFTYKANDGALDSNISTATITINPTNDLPVVGANQSFNVNDNSAYNFTLNSGTDIDVPAQTLQYKVITAPTKGTLTNCIVTGSYGTDIICTYTANVNYNGTDSFTYLVNDTVADSSSVATATFTVTDTTVPSAPAVLLASNSYTNSLSSSFTATSCTDTPFIFINESTQPTAGAAGWIACSTSAGALTYTMSAGAATKTVKLWSKDPNGNVSTASSNFTIVYEVTAPVLAITQPTYVKGNAVYAVNWTATETNVTTSQLYTVEYFNGTAWATLGTVASTNGPLTAQAFSYNWTAPAVNIATAKLRVSLTDRAGNTGTITSNAFTIDSIAPTIAISTPANNSYYATTNATITGTCEGTLPITFSGALQSSFNINCNSGTFTQNVNFSNGDGAKAITLTITDLAGNTASTLITLNQDMTAPYLTKTTGANPQYTKNNSVNWGGTCEGNLTINFTGSSVGSFNCVAGAWSWTTPAQAVDGDYSYSLQQVDSAGNTSTSLSLAWTRDNVAPALTLAQGTSGTNNLSQMTFTGDCEGVLPIVASGTESNTFSCNNGTWSYTTTSYASDSTRSFTFTQTDIASNTTAKSYSWTRNTQGPALFLSATTPLKTNTNTVTFNGTCQDGLVIDVSGAATSTATCTSGAWSWTSPTETTDATRAYTFSQTNAIPNTTSVSRTWYRKTNLPTVSAFTTTASNPSRNATIPTAMTVQSNNVDVFISAICTISDSSTTPVANNSCWQSVSGPVIAKSPAATMTISNYPHLLGWETKTYAVYVWAKDEAGNISLLTNSGTGTVNTDKINSAYDPGITPVMADVWAANVDTAANPPTLAQAAIPAGSTVYIHWKATDNTALPAGAIALLYTQDEITFNPVAGASALDNQNYGCPGIALGANEGCFKWTNGSPLNTAYKIQVMVNDQTNLSAKLISNPLNTGAIKILAGNTESGLGGSAQSAMFYTRRSGSESDPGSMVMTNNGRIYFADYKRGILTVDPADGNQKVFIPIAATSTGDGGPAINATLRFPTKIALDYQNRLLIMDINRIRRVDLNLATPTIETIVGGGASTADTIANPLTLGIYSHSSNSYTARGMVFFATPNGDIYFHSEYALKENNVSTYRLRIYKASTGQVISKYFDLTSGDWFAPATPLTNCRIINPGIRFNPANSDLTGITAITFHHPNFPSCNDGASPADGRYARTYFDPTTFAVSTNFDDSARYYYYFHTTGMNGKTYITIGRDYVNRVNFDGTYTRILGSGIRGQCVDGTAATACNIDVQDIFVTSQDKIYFVDGGLIRTVDDAGKVVTLFGQRSTYGNGVNALNSRFDDIHTLGQLDNGKVIVGDAGGYLIKEFSIEGNVNIIAGNGNAATTMNTTTAATAQGIYSAAWFVADPATGDLYIRNSYYRLSKFNYATGLYQNINNCGTVDYWDLDGQPATGRKCNGNQSYMLPLGFAGNKILTANMKWSNTDLHYEDFMWKTYDKDDSFRQAHIAGTNAPADTYTGGYVGLCTSGSPSDTCKMPHYDYTALVSWDATASRWIFGRQSSTGGVGREIWAVTPGGTTDKLALLPRTWTSYVYVREGAAQTLYYCAGGRLYRHNMATDADLGALTWSMSTMSCKGASMLWNSTRRTVIFPFEQNGIDGVAEYYVP